MKRFKLKCEEGGDFYFWVIVHDTIEEMRAGALEHSKETDETNDIGHYKNAFGVTHTFQRILIDNETNEETLLKNVGIIRLAKKHCNAEIITHEITHAALHLYRLTNKHGLVANLGRMVNRREEKLAYIIGQLFRQMNLKLYKHKIWT